MDPKLHRTVRSRKQEYVSYARVRKSINFKSHEILFIISNLQKSTLKLFKRFYVNPEAEKLLIALSFIKGKLDHLDYLKGCNSYTNSNCQKNPKLDERKKQFYDFYMKDKNYITALTRDYKPILPKDILNYFIVKINDIIKNNTDNYTSLKGLHVENNKKLRKLYKELRKQNTV